MSLLSIDATTGFLNLPTCHGKPKAIPALAPGESKAVFDQLNNVIWVVSYVRQEWMGLAIPNPIPAGPGSVLLDSTKGNYLSVDTGDSNSPLTGHGSFTWAMRCKPESTGTYQMWAAANTAVQLRINNDGSWRFIINDSGGANAGAVSYGSWQTLIAEKDEASNKVRIQKDGGTIVENSHSGATNPYPTLFLGRREDGYHAKGLMSFFASFSGLLTTAERAELNAPRVAYDIVSAGLRSKVIAWWDFRSEEAIVYDESGSYKLVNYGSAWASDD